MQSNPEPPAKRQKVQSSTATAASAPKNAEAANNNKNGGVPTRKPSELLDLRCPLSDTASIKAQKQQLDKLLKGLRKKKKIVVIAGAGISVGAGIPDFRSSTGLFSSIKTDMKLKTSGKELFDASVYMDSQLTSFFHDMVRNLHSMTAQAAPTAFHHLLATLATQGRLLRLYSQNVDCIDTQLEPLKTMVPLGNKGPWPKTIQLHGGLEKMVCSKCGWLSGFEAELFRGSEPPDCSECVEMESVRGIAGKRSLGVGKMRPRIVLYNEFNPDAEAIGAVTKADLKSRPDCLIVVGTSLKVPGVRRIVREMCGVVQDYRGGMTVWINEEEPPLGKEFEGAFDLVVKGDCEKVAKLADFPRWDGSTPPPEESGTESDSCGSFMEVDQDEPTKDITMVEIARPLTPAESPPAKSKPAKKNAKKRSAPDTQAEAQEEPPAKKQRKTTTPRANAPKKSAPKKPTSKPKAQAGGAITSVFKAAKTAGVESPKPTEVREPRAAKALRATAKKFVSTPEALVVGVPTPVPSPQQLPAIPVPSAPPSRYSPIISIASLLN
ncbi:hypothetical protein RUND412_003961 [Rhizina undulata]